jgi:hypothetical protein
LKACVPIIKSSPIFLLNGIIDTSIFINVKKHTIGSLFTSLVKDFQPQIIDQIFLFT